VHFKPLPSEKMALLYSAMDVLLNPATGEGFGVPVLEAQACGTPVIVTDFSAMQEVCGAGWKVGGQRWWTPQQSFQVKPDVADIVSALQHCYQLSPAARQELSAKAVEHASGYEVGKVVRDHMLPALDGAWDRFQDRAPVDVVSRTRAANRRKRQQKAAA
jgi:glycosyltransferase involved in cell wall biosynthesis